VGTDRQAAQDVSTVVALAGDTHDRLRGQGSDVLARTLGLPTGQPAKADPVSLRTG
jgi:hypothetical protein